MRLITLTVLTHTLRGVARNLFRIRRGTKPGDWTGDRSPPAGSRGRALVGSGGEAEAEDIMLITIAIMR